MLLYSLLRRTATSRTVRLVRPDFKMPGAFELGKQNENGFPEQVETR